MEKKTKEFIALLIGIASTFMFGVLFLICIIFNQPIALYENIMLIKVIEFLLCCFGFYQLVFMALNRIKQKTLDDLDKQ